MGKSLRSGVVANDNNKNCSRMAGPVTERLTLLEKRYSKVMVHQTYFKILDEWLQVMFGVQLFPSLKDIHTKDDDETTVDDFDNPFYELQVLYQRVSALENKLEGIGLPVTTLGNKLHPKFKVPPPPPAPAKTAIKRAYGAPPPKKRANYGRTPASEREVKTASKRLPPVLKPASSSTVVPISSKQATKSVPVEDAAASTTPSTTEKIPEDEKQKSENKVDGELIGENEIKIEKESKGPEEDLDTPPILEQQMIEKSEGNAETGVQEIATGSGESTPIGTFEDKLEEEMDTDEYMGEEEEDEDDEDYDEKPILPSPEELAYEQAGYSQSKLRASRSSKKSSYNTDADVIAIEEDQPVVTYTTRGRRHTVPRRYAEYTGHDNVASILKSQQRATTQAAKAKKAIQGNEKPKTPTKVKSSPAPKTATPKKPPADGSRPECVYQLITAVQAKEVDEAGDIVLWDAYPEVKVNQQQLISVIFRSNGMSTRLTRKMTTLVFEDQVLASTSPFGTKYYSERLPPEPLEAMVEFIAASGFDPEYTKKKIYMIVGQVCNEARAGRVRKLVDCRLPTSGGQMGEEPIDA